MDTDQLGIIFPQILIPDKKVNKQKWSVIACDQFTSNEDYWIKTARTVGGSPSSYHIIVPELFLKSGDAGERIAHAKQTMRDYIEDGVLVSLPEGIVMVERETPHGTRVGVVLAVDLEQYDIDASKKPLIRATERTVTERLPVRISLREDAVLECPHVMLLINDIKDTVIAPVYQVREKFSKIYSTPLMQNGGHVQGWFIDDPAVLSGVKDALARLKAQSRDNMLFAVGDGNHSLAAAKAVWDRRKGLMTPEERAQSPLRYALCEVVNLYDPGITVHPIHRVMFNVQDVSSALRTLVSIFNRTGQEAHMMYTRGTRAQKKEGVHTILFESKMSKGHIEVTKPNHPLASQTLTEALDMLAEELPKASIDYIHGDDEFHALARSHASLGFIMEPMQKNDIFDNVIEYGVLPKKSFSLGMAEEKRYYFECRLIVEAEDEAPEEEEPEELELEELEPVYTETQDPQETMEIPVEQDEEVPSEPDEALVEQDEEVPSEPDEEALSELYEEAPEDMEEETRVSRKPRRGFFGRKRD